MTNVKPLLSKWSSLSLFWSQCDNISLLKWGFGEGVKKLDGAAMLIMNCNSTDTFSNLQIFVSDPGGLFEFPDGKPTIYQ